MQRSTTRTQLRRPYPELQPLHTVWEAKEPVHDVTPEQPIGVTHELHTRSCAVEGAVNSYWLAEHTVHAWHVVPER